MLYFCCLKKARSINSLFKYKRSFLCLTINKDKGFRFSIRKRSVGVCGVAIATFLLASGLVFQTMMVKATEPSVAAVAGENIAAHKPASQSSIAYGGDASRAVDGNRDNAWNNRSVTHTDFQDRFLVES